jgi:hypothetical protein
MPEELAITCASRSLPLSGIGTLSATRNLYSWVTVSGRRSIRQGEKEKQLSDAITNQDSPNVA